MLTVSLCIHVGNSLNIMYSGSCLLVHAKLTDYIFISNNMQQFSDNVFLSHKALFTFHIHLYFITKR